MDKRSSVKIHVRIRSMLKGCNMFTQSKRIFKSEINTIAKSSRA